MCEIEEWKDERYIESEWYDRSCGYLGGCGGRREKLGLEGIYERIWGGWGGGDEGR